MNSRELFRRVARGLTTERIPDFEEEIREEVLARWYEEGLDRRVTQHNYRDFLAIDRHEYLFLDLEPRPGPLRNEGDFSRIEDGYRLDLPDFRLPRFWEEKAREYEARDFPLGITAWRGFMLPLFTRQSEWESIQDVLIALYDHPQLVKHTLSVVLECYMETLRLALRYLEIDFGLILEPIASKTGPVISPGMFREFVLPYQRSMVDFLHSEGVDIVIFKSFANLGTLIPSVVESGADGLWIGHVNSVIDYVELRRQYPHLLLVGGIDSTMFLQGESAIKDTVMRTVPPLLATGRYLPGLDDRAREHVRYQDYLRYKHALRSCLGTDGRQSGKSII